MLQRFFTQLPDFARPGHPVMRYLMLREGRKQSRQGRALRVVAILLMLVLLFLTGWLISTEFGRTPLVTPNPLDVVFLVLYWPLVAIQFLVRILALNTTVGVVAAEVRNGTWDTLKITTDGVLLTMKARWATAFYRLWLLLTVLLIARIVFVGIALVDLSSFQGRYLDLLLTGSVPFGPPNFPADASIIVGILVVAMMMTAAILSPFTTIAFDAALGMLIGSIARGRFVGTVAQVVVMSVRFILTGWALWVGAALLSMTPYVDLASRLSGGIENKPFLGWLGTFFGIAEGDLGLTLMHLPHVLKVWLDFDYGILIGVAFLGYVLLQALFANLLIRWAGRRAVRADNL